MKNILKTQLFIILLACVQSAWSINYPTYHGPSVDRTNSNSQIYVPLQSSPIKKPSAGYHASTRSASNQSAASGGSALGYTQSSEEFHSYGGGSSSGGASGSVSKGGSATSSSYASAGFSAMPRVKSVTDGSSFESDVAPALLGEYTPSALRAGQAPPPPPGPDDENTEDNQLPIGNGIIALICCIAAYITRKQIKK